MSWSVLKWVWSTIDTASQLAEAVLVCLNRGGEFAASRLAHSYLDSIGNSWLGKKWRCKFLQMLQSLPLALDLSILCGKLGLIPAFCLMSGKIWLVGYSKQYLNLVQELSDMVETI